MAGPYPLFWRQPFRYARWAAHEKPAIFYAIIIGISGPILLTASIPVKRAWGWQPRPAIPMTYPGESCLCRVARSSVTDAKYKVPTTPRQKLSEYDD